MGCMSLSSTSPMGPLSTKTPPSSTATLLQIFRTTAISWVMMMMVTPSRWLMSERSSRMERVVRLSRAEVGSSQRRSLGLVARARAMATRCFCPPESWLG